jgi:hypothetical protein
VVARGALRDSLGSLRNLDQLLGSIRVSPKAVSTVLPDVHAACAPMTEAVNALQAAIAIEPRAADVGSEVRDYCAPRIAEVSRALVVAQQSTMNAKNRLALDRVVSRVCPELDAARALLDMLVEAVEGRSVRLDLADAIHQACRVVETAPKGPTIAVSVSTEPSPVELVANAYAVVSLIRHALSLVAHTKGTARSLDVSFGEPGPQLRIRPSDARGSGVEFAPISIIPPTESCLRAAAGVLHADLRHVGDGAELRLVWG